MIDDDKAKCRRLARVAALLHDLTVERDALVVELRERGMTLRAIAPIAGLTHAGVLRLVERVRREAQ